MRNELINASRIHFEAHIEKHRVNVENLLQNSRGIGDHGDVCLLYTSPSPRDKRQSRMPSSA